MLSHSAPEIGELIDLMLEHPIAKATYNKSKRNWKVYWQRADLKWHSFEPSPEVESIEDFLALVQADQYACFFG
jgi:hypothetical protein